MSRPRKELPLPGDVAPSQPSPRRPLPTTPGDSGAPPPLPSRPGAPSRPAPALPEPGVRLPPRPVPRPSQNSRPAPAFPARTQARLESVTSEDGDIYNEADVGEVYQECDPVAEGGGPEESDQDEYDDFQEDSEEQEEYEDFEGVGAEVMEPEVQEEYDEFSVEPQQETYEISDEPQQEVYEAVEDVSPSPPPPPPPSRPTPQPPQRSSSPSPPPPPPPQVKRAAPPPERKAAKPPPQPQKAGGLDLSEVLKKRNQLRKVESSEERPISTTEVKEYTTGEDVRSRFQLFKQKEEADDTSQKPQTVTVANTFREKLKMFGASPSNTETPNTDNGYPPKVSLTQHSKPPPSLPSKPLPHPGHAATPPRLETPPRPSRSLTPERHFISSNTRSVSGVVSPTRTSGFGKFEKSPSTESAPALPSPVSKTGSRGALPPTPVDKPSLPPRPELPLSPGGKKDSTSNGRASPDLPPPPDDILPPRPKDPYTKVDPGTKTSGKALVPNGNQNDWPEDFDDDDQEIYDDVAAKPIDPLSEYNWYHGMLDRDVGNTKLKKLNKDGAYLMRKSNKGGPTQPYTLMVFYSNYIYNLKVRLRSDQKYALGEEKNEEVAFDTVEDLVTHHQKNDVILVHKSGRQYSTLLTVTPS